MTISNGDLGYDVRQQINRTVNRVADLRDFEAAGDGVSDDTEAITRAISSGRKYIRGQPGQTYLIDGGITAPHNGLIFDFTGCIIVIKPNATHPWALRLLGSDCKVIGGYWDGNRENGNTPSDLYGSFGVLIAGDGCAVQDSHFHNFAGMGVKFENANRMEARNVIVTGTTFYGIYGGATSQDCYDWKVLGGNFDTTLGGAIGQGILFSSANGYSVIDPEINGARVKGPTGEIAEQAINIAVRGRGAKIINNHTTGGSMGFSEGGDGCQIIGNNFLNLEGTVRFGIEPSGKFNSKMNTITGAIVGIICSGDKNYDGSTICGETIECTTNGRGVSLQPSASGSAKNVSITGGAISAWRGVATVRDASGLSILGVSFVGPGSSVNGSRVVFLDTPPNSAMVSIIGCSGVGYQRAYAVYSAEAETFSDLYAANNFLNDVGGKTFWLAEGNASIGQRVQILGISGSTTKEVFDQAGNVFEMVSTTYNDPNGLLQAGRGSIHRSLNENGGTYYKRSGTGTSGWGKMNA